MHRFHANRFQPQFIFLILLIELCNGLSHEFTYSTYSALLVSINGVFCFARQTPFHFKYKI
ncbi:MAG TPA: hypothetical protein DCE42_30560 [Myxococcales bacterium]|nr:hypothetical protein [Deltaproteobacteria bacterium]HAA59131.1 hypothetical protein [Myxococcales bacterium]